MGGALGLAVGALRLGVLAFLRIIGLPTLLSCLSCLVLSVVDR